jgi:plastocyanin
MSACRVTAVALLSLMLAAPVSAQTPALVIGVWSFDFAPKPIHLTAGHPVTLTFVNRSGSGHDFTAKAFFANANITAGAAPGGEIDLGPNQTKSITLVPRAGTYKAHCSHFLHRQFGMEDVIVVN